MPLILMVLCLHYLTDSQWWSFTCIILLIHSDGPLPALSYWFTVMVLYLHYLTDSQSWSFTCIILLIHSVVLYLHYLTDSQWWSFTCIILLIHSDGPFPALSYWFTVMVLYLHYLPEDCWQRYVSHHAVQDMTGEIFESCNSEKDRHDSLLGGNACYVSYIWERTRPQIFSFWVNYRREGAGLCCWVRIG